MTKKNNKYTKVLFRYHSNVLDETTVETMWAIKVDEKNGIYKLDSIPFYGPQIATDDEFFGTPPKLNNAKFCLKHPCHQRKNISCLPHTERGIGGWRGEGRRGGW